MGRSMLKSRPFRRLNGSTTKNDENGEREDVYIMVSVLAVELLDGRARPSCFKGASRKAEAGACYYTVLITYSPSAGRSPNAAGCCVEPFTSVFFFFSFLSYFLFFLFALCQRVGEKCVRNEKIRQSESARLCECVKNETKTVRVPVRI